MPASSWSGVIRRRGAGRGWPCVVAGSSACDARMATLRATDVPPARVEHHNRCEELRKFRRRRVVGQILEECRHAHMAVDAADLVIRHAVRTTHHRHSRAGPSRPSAGRRSRYATGDAGSVRTASRTRCGARELLRRSRQRDRSVDRACSCMRTSASSAVQSACSHIRLCACATFARNSQWPINDRSCSSRASGVSGSLEGPGTSRWRRAMHLASVPGRASCTRPGVDAVQVAVEWCPASSATRTEPARWSDIRDGMQGVGVACGTGLRAEPPLADLDGNEGVSENLHEPPLPGVSIRRAWDRWRESLNQEDVPAVVPPGRLRQLLVDLAFGAP